MHAKDSQKYKNTYPKHIPSYKMLRVHNIAICYTRTSFGSLISFCISLLLISTNDGFPSIRSSHRLSILSIRCLSIRKHVKFFFFLCLNTKHNLFVFPPFDTNTPSFWCISFFHCCQKSDFKFSNFALLCLPKRNLLHSNSGRGRGGRAREITFGTP